MEKASLRTLTGWWSGWSFGTIDLEFLTSGRDFWNKSVKKISIWGTPRFSKGPHVKNHNRWVNWQMMAGSQTGTIRLLGDFWSESSSRGNVTDDNSSTGIWQLASGKSYGDQLEVCQQRFWRPSIRQREGRWILPDYSPNLNVAQQFLLLPNQRELLNDNASDIFLKNLSFSFLKEKANARAKKSVIFRGAKLAGVFDKDSEREFRSKLLTDCFNATSNVSLKTRSRLDVLPYCLYIRKSM